jgi:Bacteriocin-protection, YdeI or OmpD-Associated
MTKTIVEKLNLKKYKKATVLNSPANVNYFADLPKYDTDLSNHPYDLIFAFVLDIESLKELVTKIIDNHYLDQKGYIFIAYPKKGNKAYPTYIHRDDLFEGLGADESGYIGSSSVKFARMVGLDDIFTVVGLKDESKGKAANSSKASQCVDDYIDMIPNIEKDLEDSPEILTIYKSLTPGYRKDWARYIYSAKQEVTKAKRREEMKIVLGAGYKTIDLYRRDKK